MPDMPQPPTPKKRLNDDAIFGIIMLVLGVFALIGGIIWAIAK